MTREKFIELLDETVKSIHAETLELYDKGVPVERCLTLAIQIHDARAAGRMQRTPQIVPGAPFIRRQ